MADGTQIEWTDATANFINGCSVLSPGCKRCYAMRLAGTRMKDHPTRAGLTIETAAGPVWTGEIRPHWPALAQVLSWGRPRDIFWNAHGDLFHDGVSDALIDANVAAIALTPQHRHQLLTKRSPRMREYFHGLDREGGIGRVARFAQAMELIHQETGHHLVKLGKGVPFVQHPLPNLWMGVSAEDQQRWDERTADLRQINAAVRWVSAEPLLGPVVDRYAMLGIDWVVVGGESGDGSRPLRAAWARSFRDQCAAARTPFLFKQWGDFLPEGQFDRTGFQWCPGSADSRVHWWENVAPTGPIPDDACAVRIGKKAAGRMLDRSKHDGMPA